MNCSQQVCRENLKSEGAIFVEELNEIKDKVDRLFSAHGVPKCSKEALELKLLYFDATCPLVSKFTKS